MKTNLTPKQNAILRDLDNGEKSFWKCRTLDSLVERGLIEVVEAETQCDPDTKKEATLCRINKLSKP